jgi:hypothetical protein
MSSVRMCDRCGTIFSENADDWSTFSGVRRIRDKATGRFTHEELLQDACPTCTKRMYEPTNAPMVNGKIADDITE